MRFSRLGLWLGWAVLTGLLFAAPAHAWGPGAHVEASMFVLKHLALLAPGIARLLKHHGHAFIYGAVSPDMVLGKRYMKPERNNHRWETGFAISAGARTDRERAFALGYLSHLAADTIAHNLYVPDRLLSEYARRRRSHVMHELVFDSTLEPDVWATARAAASEPFPECDALLFSNLDRTPLPRKVNHRLFHGAMALVRVGGWQKIIGALQNRWEGQVDETVMMRYRAQVHRTVLEFLQCPDTASCLKHSPTGGEVLPQAENLKAMLKKLDRETGVEPAAHQEIITAFRRWREETMAGAE